jgi:hypothetical protein
MQTSALELVFRKDAGIPHKISLQVPFFWENAAHPGYRPRPRMTKEKRR